MEKRKIFKKYLDYNNREQCIDFLNKHFKVNGVKDFESMSFANNISFLYTLPDCFHKICFETITDNEVVSAKIDEMIGEFKNENPKYGVYRSEENDNNIVLMHRRIIDNEGHVIIRNFDMFPYSEFSTEQLMSRVILVQKFDKLCDRIIDYYMSHIALYKPNKIRKG